MKLIFLSFLIFLSQVFAFANNPIELGTVNWLRDFEAALQQSQQQQKPILILFQEVPGCSTCTKYGNQVLSHPLIVEAIEDLFIPLAIYNNGKGRDRIVLEAFKEPAWNNPVVRVIDSSQKDIVDRLSANYSPIGLVNTMIEALQKSQTKIPTYLHLLQKELTSIENGTERVYVSMYCFWTGEKSLGHLEGVIATEAGFMNGKEVVEVNYDATQISLENILKHGKKKGCTDAVFSDNKQLKNEAALVVGNSNIANEGKFIEDSASKYYLSKSIYKYIPMTKLQKAKTNSLIAFNQSPEIVLSPRQIQLVNYIHQHKNKSWKSYILSDSFGSDCQEVVNLMNR